MPVKYTKGMHQAYPPGGVSPSPVKKSHRLASLTQNVKVRSISRYFHDLFMSLRPREFRTSRIEIHDTTQVDLYSPHGLSGVAELCFLYLCITVSFSYFSLLFLSRQRKPKHSRVFVILRNSLLGKPSKVSRRSNSLFSSGDSTSKPFPFFHSCRLKVDRNLIPKRLPDLHSGTAKKSMQSNPSVRTRT